MLRQFVPRRIRPLICAVVAACGVRSSLAATSLPPFPGQLTGAAAAPAEPLTLWYRQPATQWTQALPVGNGRQGAMMFGGIDQEVICLNETNLWSGGPYAPENPDALAALPQVRGLLFDQQFREAERLITQRMMAKPATQAAFQPVGDVLLKFPKVAAAENYRRELNLKTATATSQFTSDGVTYTRELFCSGPDNVLVLRLTASKPGRIAFKLSMQTAEPSPQGDGTDDTLIVTGSNRGFSGNGVNVPAALKYQSRAKILHAGGKLTKGTPGLPPPPPPAATAPAGRGAGRGGAGVPRSRRKFPSNIPWKGPIAPQS